MKKYVVWLVLLLLMGQFLMLTGCGRQEGTERDPEAEEMVVAPVVSIAITSKAELDRLWKRYIYHAGRILISKEPFTTAVEVDPEAIVHFCWEKYVIDHGMVELEANLDAAGEEGGLKLFPLAIAQEYAQRYFNLTDIDINRMDEVHYDAAQEGFAMYLTRVNIVPYYLTMNNSNVMHEAIRHADGSITVILHDYTYGDVVNQISQFTLMEHPDGSMYIAGGRKDYVEQWLAIIQGAYQEFGYPEILNRSHMVQLISEGKDNIVIQTGNRETPLIQLDLERMIISDEIKLGKQVDFRWAREKDEKLYVGLDDRVQVYDLDLEFIEEVYLPDTMMDKAMDDHDHVRGYDISADLSKITYTDNQGLKLVELNEGHEKLIVASEQYRFQNTIDFTVNYAYPRFVAGDSRILAVKTGYEGNAGYYIFDFLGSELIHTRAFEGIATNRIYPGQSMMANIYTPEHMEDQAINNYRISYLDFEQAVTRTVDQDLLGGYTGDIIGSNRVCNGETYSAFLTRDYMEDIWYVKRIDNETLEVEGNLLSIQHAQVELIGVLGDGRILFSYYRNSVEKGLGLIPVGVLE